MRDFEYKYKDYKYRIKPWFKLIPAEKSWIIYRAYKTNRLESKDVKSMVHKKLAYSFNNIVFPVGAYIFAGTFLKQNPRLLRYLSKDRLLGA